VCGADKDTSETYVFKLANFDIVHSPLLFHPTTTI
jgi:hypothetical protein